MSDAPPKIDIYQTRRFEKALDKLPSHILQIVEDEIEKLIDNPLLGEQKKGDLSYLRVHKFTLNQQQILLGYSWQDKKLELYLLSLAPHENFYRDLKSRRKADLKWMD